MARELTKYLLLLLLVVLVHAQATYQILNMAYNAKQLSMSQSGSSLADGAFFHNPSSMETANQSLGFSYHRYPADISLENLYYSFMFKGHLFNTYVTKLDFGTLEDGKTLETFTAKDMVLGIAYKNQFRNRISYGVSIEYLYSTIENYYSDLFSLSLGFRSRFIDNRLGLGLSIENLCYILTGYTNYRNQLPAQYRLSTYYKLQYLKGLIALDVYKNIDKGNLHYVVGFEYAFNQTTFVRIGTGKYRLGLLTFKEEDFYKELLLYGFSYGFGFRVNRYNIDLAIQSLGAAGYVMGLSLNYPLNYK